MIRPLIAAAMAVLFASNAFAVGNSNVNVNINTHTVFLDRITEVEVDGGIPYAFPDPFTAPDLADASTALATGLVELGYPPGTVATVQSIVEIGNDSVFEEIVTSNYNPIDDPGFVIGDPNDYSTWIAIGPEDVNVNVEQTTTNYTFHRLEAATASCGDGVLQTGETCDDGNTDDGDCCSSSCQYEPAGSACEDGVVCTALDTCDGLGACQAGGPATGCVSPWAKANLLIKEKKAGKEKFILKIKGGPALAQGDFGDPVTGDTAYDICVFDDAGDLAFSLAVDRAGATCAGKPCWKAKKDTGWLYKDKDTASDGVKIMKLFGGAAGKTQIQVLAANNDKKGQLSMPTGIATTLQAATSARVQVVTSEDQCFDVTVDQIKKQDADFFKGIKK